MVNIKKKQSIINAAISLLLILLFSVTLSGCNSISPSTDMPEASSSLSPSETVPASPVTEATPTELPSPTNSPEPTSSETTLPITDFDFPYLDEIGKTYNLIKQENPNLEFQEFRIPDAGADCMGSLDGKFSYYFFGRVERPYLEDLCDEFGNELVCSGIVSTVGEMFPETTEQIPLELFFNDNRISEYTFTDEIQSDTGWISFRLDDFIVFIDTIGNMNVDEYKKIITMKRSYTIIIVNEKIERGNIDLRYANMFPEWDK